MPGEVKDKTNVVKQLALPMLPMRDIVVFPHMTAPFFIGRTLSIASLEKALAGDRQIFVVAQEDPLIEEPEAKDLFRVGTIGQVLQIMRLHNGTIKALFEAKSRGRLIEAHMEEPHFAAVVQQIPENVSRAPELIALSKNVRTEFKRYLKDVKRRTEGIEKLTVDSDEPHILADRIAPLLNMELRKKQDLLENADPKERLEIVYGRMLEEKEFKKVERKLKERVQGQIGRTQKEYYLNEQVKAIQKELGHGEDGKAEMEEYAKKIEEIKLSGPIYQAGTLSGNPLAVAAGVTTLGILKEQNPYSELGQKTAWLCEELKKAAEAVAIPIQTQSIGGMFGYFFSENKVSNFQEALNSDTRKFTKFFQNMLKEGIYLPPSAFESLFISTAHSEEDLEKTASAFRKSLRD